MLSLKFTAKCQGHLCMNFTMETKPLNSVCWWKSVQISIKNKNFRHIWIECNKKFKRFDQSVFLNRLLTSSEELFLKTTQRIESQLGESTETESYTIQRDNQKHNIEQNKLFSINIDFYNISVDLLLLLNNVKYLLYEMPLYLRFRTDHTTGQYRKHLNNCPIYNVTGQGILSPSNNN